MAKNSRFWWSLRRPLWLCVLWGSVGCAALSGKSDSDVGTLEVRPSTFVREVEAEGALRPIKATRITPPSDVPDPLKIVYLAEDGAVVKKGDVLVRFDDGDFRRTYEREGYSGRDSAAKLEKERTLAGSTLANRERAAAIAEREQELGARFQRKDEEIFSRHQIIESEIDQGLQASRLLYAKQAQQIDTRIAQTKVDLLAVDQAKANLQMRQASKALGKLELKAPHDGVFVLERNWMGEAFRIGDVVRSSQTIAQIPLLNAMEAEVFVLEADAEGLEPGRPASLTLDAAPNRSFSGKVRRVENIAKRRYQGVPTQYFAVTLSLSETDPSVMKPGKRVTAKLNLGSVQGLVLPRQTVFEKDQDFFVFVAQKDDGFERTKVELGPTTAGRVLIRRGLKPGDRVALRDPFAQAEEKPISPNEPSRSAAPQGKKRRNAN